MYYNDLTEETIPGNSSVPPALHSMVAPTVKSVLGMCYEAQLTTPNPGKQLS